MTVNATSPVASPAASGPTGSSASAATQSLSYNDFLTLLMAEMKNQDPAQPGPSQMVSQLATVSELGKRCRATPLAPLLTATRSARLSS